MASSRVRSAREVRGTHIAARLPLARDAFNSNMLSAPRGLEARGLSTGSGLYGAQAESNMLNYDLTPAK